VFPKLIDLGGFYLPTYGVMVALGFLAGLWVTAKLARRRGLDLEKINNLAVYCALAGLLGAKLFMFLFDWDIYLRNPSEIFTIETLQAAGVYQGGFLLAFLGAIYWIRSWMLPLLATMDCFAPGIALGHAIGRLGCFAAGCCWGAKCDRPWAITFTNVDAARLTGVPLGEPLHPAQLYESAGEVVLFALLWRMAKSSNPDGSVLAAYLILYSLLRFTVEFFRFHAQALPFGGPFSITQWISIAMLLMGVWLLAVSRRKPAHA
jgi:phosphatidylglycerol:prolipoprotein diacylglycerol transferase